MNQIAQLFQKDIHRNINGVIKVGQLDDTNIRQELEEYIITKELNRHFQAFFERYAETLGKPTDKIGVWISGFFGSGKSHFLKILSYLLENRQLGDKQALDYFERERIPDAIVQANIIKAARSSTDVILFNIDSKADASSKSSQNAIVKVFQQVFDDYLGYLGTSPAIAEFERHLDKQGKYDAFQTAFYEVSGTQWTQNRDAWGFYQDEISQALQKSLGMSEASAARLIDLQEQNYHPSVEKFAKTVKEYLDGQEKQHRLVFLVDEVGQYIGENSDLMLNLQTVVEDLGVHCQGKAWVIVTSQEAIDEITKHKLKGRDFSKIVGRFGRPLNLSSANTDEVIKLRLLKKNEAATQSLAALYQQKTAILRNQINFIDCADLPGYNTQQDFISTYPFIPYQFNLLQKVFTQIRLMGAAGKHLAEGERSLLDAFQIASKVVADEALGALVPFHLFYLAVEGFLDGGIRRVIDQAADNPGLQPFDIKVLKTLFLIKYVKEIRVNVENLTTLSLTEIDQDRIKLKEEVEKALTRLEKQTLIQRIGNIYTFLTHEEQDIGREIKNTPFTPAEITEKLQNLIWDTIFTDKKFRYDKRHDYGFNRKLDDQTFGQQTHDIGLHIITPYADRYRELSEDSQCLLETGSGQEVMARLPDDSQLIDELQELVRTEKYLRHKHTGNLTPTAQKILADRGAENGHRRERLQQMLETLITRADVFAHGTKITIDRSDPKKVFYEGLIYLINNVYTKLNYIDSGFETELDITHAFLKEHQQQDLTGKVFNSAAHQEMQTWLNDEAKIHRQVTIKTLIDKFNARPYGWSELDILGVMAELVNQGKVEIRHAQSSVNPRESGFVAQLRSRRGLTEYTIRLGEIINPTSVKTAKDLASELFTVAPAKDALKLYEDYLKGLNEQKSQWEGWKAQIERDRLPFLDRVHSAIDLLTDLLSQDSAASFFDAVRSHREDLEDYCEERQQLTSFFNGQLKLFLQAREDVAKLEPELHHLNDPDLNDRLETVRFILSQKDPTKRIPELPLVLDPIKKKVAEALESYSHHIAQKSNKVKENIARYVADTYSQVVDVLDIQSLHETVDRVITNQTKTLDSAIARETQLDNLYQSSLQEIDRQVAEILQKREKLEKESSISASVMVKPVVSLQLSEVSPKNVIETPEDVDEYVEALKQALLTKIQQNYRIRIN